MSSYEGPSLKLQLIHGIEQCEARVARLAKNEDAHEAMQSIFNRTKAMNFAGLSIREQAMMRVMISQAYMRVALLWIEASDTEIENISQEIEDLLNDEGIA